MNLYEKYDKITEGRSMQTIRPYGGRMGRPGQLIPNTTPVNNNTPSGGSYTIVYTNNGTKKVPTGTVLTQAEYEEHVANRPKPKPKPENFGLTPEMNQIITTIQILQNAQDQAEDYPEDTELDNNIANTISQERKKLIDLLADKLPQGINP